MSWPVLVGTSSGLSASRPMMVMRARREGGVVVKGRWRGVVRERIGEERVGGRREVRKDIVLFFWGGGYVFGFWFWFCEFETGGGCLVGGWWVSGVGGAGWLLLGDFKGFGEGVEGETCWGRTEFVCRISRAALSRDRFKEKLWADGRKLKNTSTLVLMRRTSL